MNLIRSFASVAAGYLSLLFLTIFPRIVFSLYSRSELRIHTIRLSDAPLQDYALIGMDLFGAVLASLITISICRQNEAWHLVALAILMIPEALYMLSLPGPSESTAIVIITLCLRGFGFFLGYMIQSRLLNPK